MPATTDAPESKAAAVPKATAGVSEHLPCRPTLERSKTTNIPATSGAKSPADPVGLQRSSSKGATAEPQRRGRFQLTVEASAETGTDVQVPTVPASPCGSAASGPAGLLSAAATSATPTETVSPNLRPDGTALSSGPPSDGSGVRRGRFIVSAVTNSPGMEDEVMDDTSTTPDSASQCPDRDRHDPQDVLAFLLLKQQEMGALFNSMRDQIVQVMSAGQSSSSASSNASIGTRELSSSSGMASAAPAIEARSHATPSGGASHEEREKAINLWEELGKPIERATRRNRQLEDENVRLQRQVKQKRNELEMLKGMLSALQGGGAAYPGNMAATVIAPSNSTPSMELSPTAAQSPNSSSAVHRSPMFGCGASTNVPADPSEQLQQLPPLGNLAIPSLSAGPLQQLATGTQTQPAQMQNLAGGQSNAGTASVPMLSVANTPQFSASPSPEQPVSPLTSPLLPNGSSSPGAWGASSASSDVQLADAMAASSPGKGLGGSPALEEFLLRQVEGPLSSKAEVAPAPSSLQRSGSYPAVYRLGHSNRVPGVTGDTGSYGTAEEYRNWRLGAHRSDMEASPNRNSSG
eukprot:TRINITY_DN112342_c0_g1_i1.p1 TRINITY_DN112342_c0_g1~~TRINITY_DN112342_c0_g1_i1.p1  ORF type:complete len:578 (-),score=93.91 TRINITY_DN112342_c0_g1_i1:37-1770(-)